MTRLTMDIRWRIMLAASIITAAASLAVLPATGTASDSGAVKGGSGVITTHGVGTHRFEVTHRASIRAFAGTPNSIRYENKLGDPTGARGAVWEIWTYQFAGGGYVYYSFHHTLGSWIFVEIDTNRTQFSTARGTRVGMSYAEAKTREGVSYLPGCIDSGFWHFRDAHRYAVVVGVDRGQPVHALHGYGPHPPVC